ncbi:PrgI family protein [Candidatus Uhrbacteria bacterium]|nr:PrgI family protein [Candidatus Uhrbacteria bacterium]
MQRFTVPQFIDVEDKIIGPVTTRQFLIMMVTVLFVMATYAAADFSLFIFLAIFELTAGSIVAFLKINGRPFHFFILNVIQTLKRPSIRVWRKEIDVATVEMVVKELHPVILRPASDGVTQKKAPTAQTLRDLVMVLDTGGKYTGDEI